MDCDKCKRGFHAYRFEKRTDYNFYFDADGNPHTHIPDPNGHADPGHAGMVGQPTRSPDLGGTDTDDGATADKDR